MDEQVQRFYTVAGDHSPYVREPDRWFALFLSL
jgi:hypothetical protein